MLAALQFDNQAQFHPRAFCLGLVSALRDGGNPVYTHSRVTDIDFDEHEAFDLDRFRRIGEIVRRPVALERRRSRGPRIAEPLLVEEMFTLIARIAAEGLAVMLVEQNVVQSLELASRAYVMENGRIVVAGAAAEIGADPALKHAYLGL